MVRMLPGVHEQNMSEMRTATREANEALADIKRTLSEIKTVRIQVHRDIDTIFEDKVASAVAERLAEYQTTLDKAIEDGTQAVYARFDQLTAIMLGETKADKRAGRESLPDAIDKLARCEKCGIKHIKSCAT